ncbi:hypothetical protein D5S18_18595 [Nocardia panacis]|uniref:Phage head morphogenesis domain-containing protein n=1 Tax=Nocardia panacis TaxID=2340916 RepID=A0A3A4JVD1_9NOCA|nr:hypothetical protein D5S18_18595 [Nocardia panacis]
MVAAAAAAIAAASTQAGVLSLAAVTNSTAAVLDRVRSVTQAQIAARWRSVNPYKADEVAAFAADAAKILAAAQQQMGTAAAAGQGAALQAMGIPVKIAPPTIPTDVRVAQRRATGAAYAVQVTYQGQSEKPAAESTSAATTTVAEAAASEPTKPVTVDVPLEDSTTEAVLQRPASTFRYEVSTGSAPEQAANRAAARLDSVVDGNLSLAMRDGQRQALQQAEEQTRGTDQHVTHWRRVFHPELSKGGTCGLCIVASDRTYTVEDLMPIHDRCKCTVVAAGEFTSDLGRELNKSDFQKLYGDAQAAAEHGSSAKFESLWSKYVAKGRYKTDNRASFASTRPKFLKKNRYKVEHHHELGPQLVRATGSHVEQLHANEVPSGVVDLDAFMHHHA